MDKIPNPQNISRLCSDKEVFILNHGIEVYYETFPMKSKDKVNNNKSTQKNKKIINDKSI